MRIAVIGDHVHPVAAPFAGGLEAMTWYLSRDLARRGHEVTLFAQVASEVPGVRVEGLARSAEISDIARHDVSMPSVAFLGAHHAYLDAINRLTREPEGYDVVQIHALHHLPVALARLFAAPVVLTLHSPPTPWLEAALSVAGDDAPRLVTVSRANSALWAETVDQVQVIPNGVDLERWRPGSGARDQAIWSGRMVAEKAPHLAVAAARRAGMALVLAGPIEDAEYFGRWVAPHLDERITYAGLVGHQELSAMIGESRVCLQTPQWDEPYCLAAAEAIACGTPVASFNRGGLAEVVGRAAGVLAEPGDVGDLARAATVAAGLPRAGVRAHAERTLSLARCVSRYEGLYGELMAERVGDGVERDDPTLLLG